MKKSSSISSCDPFFSACREARFLSQDLEDRFFAAVSFGTFAEVEQWVTSFNCVNIHRRCDGFTPLHVAVSRNDTGMVKALLRLGADPNLDPTLEITKHNGMTDITELRSIPISAINLALKCPDIKVEIIDGLLVAGAKASVDEINYFNKYSNIRGNNLNYSDFKKVKSDDNLKYKMVDLEYKVIDPFKNGYSGVYNGLGDLADDEIISISFSSSYESEDDEIQVSYGQLDKQMGECQSNQKLKEEAVSNDVIVDVGDDVGGDVGDNVEGNNNQNPRNICFKKEKQNTVNSAVKLFDLVSSKLDNALISPKAPEHDSWAMEKLKTILDSYQINTESDSSNNSLGNKTEESGEISSEGQNSPMHLLAQSSSMDANLIKYLNPIFNPYILPIHFVEEENEKSNLIGDDN